jgi:PAS domain S-box-containing protein
VGFVLAVGLPALIALVITAVDDIDYRLGVLYVAAIALVAVVASTSAAIVCSVVGLLAFCVTVAPPTGTLRVSVPDGVVSIGVFALCAGAIVMAARERDRAAERTTALARRYRRLADVGLIGVVFWRVDGRRVGANDAYLHLLGHTREDFEQGRIDWSRVTPPEYAAIDAENQAELRTHGFCEPYEKEYVAADGRRVPVLVTSALLEDPAGEGVSFVLDITERWELAREREALLESERAARQAAEAASRWLQLLAEASERLLGLGEPDAVARTLADIVVPEIAPVATVFVPEGDLLRRAITAHADQPELAERVTREFPMTVGSDSPAAEAARSRRTVAVPAEANRGFRPLRADTGYLTALAAMELGDGAVIPMCVHDDVVGVLSVSTTRRRGPLDPDAVLVAEQIAQRAALAMQRAQSHAEQRRLSSRMQQALLPPGADDVAGHDIGTCYVPATLGHEVGGDWWDVLTLPDGRTALVVGDVSGHGLDAAPIMAKLRHSIDGVLAHGAGPAAAARAASHVLHARRPDSYATAFIAVYDPTRRELVYTRAGHPPPLVLVGDEVVELDEPGGTLLGLVELERREHVRCLPAGFELLAYTDGLVEVPGRDYDEGVDRLVAALRALPPDLPAQQRAERLVADVVGEAGRDDACVLLLRHLDPAEDRPAGDDRTTGAPTRS